MWVVGCICACTFACVFICMYVSVSETQTVRRSMCLTVGCFVCVCVCVDVDCMYYADLGEPCAINKTGLQCAHWRNNLSDTMEKERERERSRVRSTGRERERETGKE